MAYEIWDGASGNLNMARPTRDEALRAIREVVELRGREYAQSLALLFEDDEGETAMIAEGRELIALATSPLLDTTVPLPKRTRAQKSA